jgi:hypothetical protein
MSTEGLGVHTLQPIDIVAVTFVTVYHLTVTMSVTMDNAGPGIQCSATLHLHDSAA